MYKVNKDNVAPAHARKPEQGIFSGIEIKGNEATLYQYDEEKKDFVVTAKGTHSAPTEWDYFYNLTYLETFPEVELWWFSSPWTQRFKVSSIGDTDEVTTSGHLQYISDDTNTGFWTITTKDRGKPPYVWLTMPQDEEQSNMPLMIKLSFYIMATLFDEVSQNEWYTITSLVHRDEIANILPDSPYILDEENERTWTFDVLQGTDIRSFALGQQHIINPHIKP